MSQEDTTVLLPQQPNGQAVSRVMFHADIVGLFFTGLPVVIFKMWDSNSKICEQNIDLSTLLNVIRPTSWLT